VDLFIIVQSMNFLKVTKIVFTVKLTKIWINKLLKICVVQQVMRD